MTGTAIAVMVLAMYLPMLDLIKVVGGDQGASWVRDLDFAVYSWRCSLVHVDT